MFILSPERLGSLLGDEREGDIVRRFRLIPVETVGGKRLQRAYLPDCVYLSDSGGRHSADALIAAAETLRGAGVYEAIVPSEMV